MLKNPARWIARPWKPASAVPSIEESNPAGQIMLEDATYDKKRPFRINAQLPAGALTARMAVPWQADFHECATEEDGFSNWWPGQRPTHVFGSGRKGSGVWMPDEWERVDMVNSVDASRIHRRGHDRRSDAVCRRGARFQSVRGLVGKPFDAAVIGGGPAGASLAIALSRARRSVAVLERSGYEQPRIGETLPPAACVPLAELGVWDWFRTTTPPVTRHGLRVGPARD